MLLRCLMCHVVWNVVLWDVQYVAVSLEMSLCSHSLFSVFLKCCCFPEMFSKMFSCFLISCLCFDPQGHRTFSSKVVDMGNTILLATYSIISYILLGTHTQHFFLYLTYSSHRPLDQGQFLNTVWFKFKVQCARCFLEHLPEATSAWWLSFSRPKCF